MAEEDKVKYSDIIEPDDSIEKLIKQLEEVNKSYSEMVSAIKEGASKIASSVKAASGATNEGRKAIDEATQAAERLDKANKELKFALSDTGKQVAWLKAQTVDANKATVEQQRYLKMAVSSYDQLKADLKQTVALYKSLTAEERANKNIGQSLLNDIINFKGRLKELDDQMRPHIQQLSEVEKAENRLAFLQSEEGKKLLELKAKIAELTAARKQQKEATDPIAKAQEKLDYLQTEEGQQLLELKNKISEVIAARKLQSESVSPVAKAEEKLAYLQSEEGQRLLELREKISEVIASRKQQKESIDPLTKAQEKLDYLQTEEGQKLLEIKAKINELTAARRQQKSATDPVTKAQEKLAYLQSEEGQKLLELKEKIAEIIASRKPQKDATDLIAKAEEKLAFLQSEEGQKLLELKAKIAELTAARRQQKEVVDNIAKAEEKLRYAQSEENEQLKLLNMQTREANRIAQLNAQVANSVEGSYNRLSAQYGLNKIKLDAMSAAERNATEEGKKLVAETNRIYQEMIKLQEETGNYRLSVGHYEKSWDALGMSISQVVRELPAAVVSINTFFLGISNNIPMVVDEINKLRRQNELLRAEGKPTISITKSIIRSLFGWNTALVVVLTTLSMYGKEIFKWIDNILSGKGAVLSMTDAMETLNEEMAKSHGTYGREITILRRLSDEWARLGDNVEKQKQFIKDNQTEFSNLDVTISDVNDAEALFVDKTDVFIEALKARAKAQAALNLLSKQYEDLLDLENKAEIERTKDYSFFDNLSNYFKALWGGISGPDTDLSLDTRLKKQRQRNIESINEDAAGLQETIDNYFKVYQFYTDKEKELLKDVGLDTAHKKERTRAKRDAEDTLESLSLAAYKAYQKSLTELEREEINKRRQQYISAYNVEIADLNAKYAKIQRILSGNDERYKTLTDEQKAKALTALNEIAMAIENKAKTFNFNIGQLSLQEQQLEYEHLLDTLNLQLKAVKQGSLEELNIRKQILDVEEKIALVKNAQLPASQQQSPADISAGYTKQKTQIETEYTFTGFEQQQALDEAIFNEVKRSETEITKFKLQQEKARWEEQIRLAEAGALDWTDAQIEAAKHTVNGIERELSELDDFIFNIGKKGLGTTLLESLGFNDDQIDALKDATNIVIEQFQAILDAEVELAEKAVELAEERVSAAERAYEAEIEARNNGYANSVSTARKELENEKRNQMQKQKLLETAQRRQDKLDSLTQSASLTTASANLWSAFSKIPFVGPALAMAAIATMWASFAAAKIKAKQVTAVQSEEYGEGGLEFLEGGSHASGNDIDLGVKNKKKRRMKAEGGEALAIINKRRTRKYRKILPDVIDSFNKGIFEDKYANIFDSAKDQNISINQTNADSINLRRIERSLDKIIEQNDERIFVDGQGRTIVKRNGLTKIIRS